MGIEQIWSFDYDPYADLSEHHQDQLCNESGLSPEILNVARPFSLHGRFVSEFSLKIRILERIGLPTGYNRDLLVFPYPSYNDLFRVRLDVPEKDKDGKDIRYKQPRKQRNVPYKINAVNSKLDDILCITEGEKKSLALAQAGFNVVGFGGVWNWRDKASATGVIPDFEECNLSGKRIAIIFDSDIATNKMVLSAEDNLVDFCLDRGAVEVLRVRIPYSTGHKLGIDDYFREFGSHKITDLLQSAVSEKGFISGLDLRGLELEPSSLLTTFLPESSLVLVAGVPGAGKTEFLIQQAIEAASYGRVLYYLSEGGEYNLQQRQNAYCQDEDVLKNIFWECRRTLFFGDPDGIIKFERILNTYKPGVVFIDPGPDAFGEENDAAALKEPLQQLYLLTKKHHCCIVLSWHFSKVLSYAGVYSFRGSSAIAGKMDIVYSLTVSDNKRYIKLDKTRLTCDGLHHGQKWMIVVESDELTKQMQFINILEAIEAKQEKRQKNLSDALAKFDNDKEYTSPEIIKVIIEAFNNEIKESTAKNHLKAMQRNGELILIKKHSGSNPAMYRKGLTE